MKIIKENINKRLTEDDENGVELDSASVEEIEDEVKEDEAVTNAGAKKIAQEVDDYSKVIYNSFGTANPGKLEKVLQRSFEVALRQKRTSQQANFPNVLVYGRAGVGKTAIVKKFCNSHGVKLVTINAATTAPEQLSGIPYPKTDKATGEVYQVAVQDPIWKELEHPCIIFCDEINRANPRLTNNLFSLINEHVLPMRVFDAETGRYQTEKFFPHILFTVSNINPPTGAYKKTVEPLDPAFMSRQSAVVGQEADSKELLAHFDSMIDILTAEPVTSEAQADKQFINTTNKMYSDFLKTPNLKEQDIATLNGIRDLSHAILSSPMFSWTSADEEEETYMMHKNEGKTYNYLNPRSLTLFLFRSNGTKKDFLYVIKHESGLPYDKVKMFENILATYTDKQTVGNNVFNKPSGTMRAVQQSAEDQLNDFINSLN